MLTNQQFADNLANLEAQFNAGTITQTQYADAYKLLLDDWMIQLTAGGLGVKVRELISKFNEKWSTFTTLTQKGVKALVADLPATGNSNGDWWWVNEPWVDYPNGQAYVWITNAWYAQGDKLIKGMTGVGIPTGGVAGDILVKNSADDYDFRWSPPAEDALLQIDEAADQALEEIEDATNTQLALIRAATGATPYASEADALSKGVVGVASLVVGSGATTPGVYDLTFTGGGGSGAAGRFLVAAGSVVAGSIVITAKGRGYTSNPTPVFTAAPGLTGASATAITAQNQPPGTIFAIPVPTGFDQRITDPGGTTSTSQGIYANSALLEATTATVPDGLADVTFDALGRIISQVNKTDGSVEFGSLRANLLNDIPSTRLAEAVRQVFNLARYRGPPRFPFDINIILGSGQSNSWEGADGTPAVSTTPIPGVMMMDAIRGRHFVGTRYQNGLTPCVEVDAFPGEVGATSFGEGGGFQCCATIMRLVALENRSTYSQHRKILVPLSIGHSSSDTTSFGYGTADFTLATNTLNAIKALTTNPLSIHYGKTVGIIGLLWRWGAQGYVDGISAATWQSKLTTYFGQVDQYLGHDIFNQPVGTIPIGISQTFAHASRGYGTNPYGAEAENALVAGSDRIHLVNPEGPYFLYENTATGTTSAIHHSAGQYKRIGDMEGVFIKRRCIDRESWDSLIPTIARTGANQVTLTFAGIDTNVEEMRPALTGLSPGSMATNYGFFLYDPATPTTEVALARLPTISGNQIIFDTVSALPTNLKIRYSARGAAAGQGNIRVISLFAEYANQITIGATTWATERWIPTIDRVVP